MKTPSTRAGFERLRGEDLSKIPREQAAEMVRRLISLNAPVPRGILTHFIETLGFDDDAQNVRRWLEDRRTFNNWALFEGENSVHKNYDLKVEVEINYWCWILERTVRFMRGVNQPILERLIVL